MEVRRAGANRNSGYTVLVNKAPSVTWRASTGHLQLDVRRVSHGDQGQYNYTVLLTADDIAELLSGLSKEAATPAVADVVRPLMRELGRLQLAAAGVPLLKD